MLTSRSSRLALALLLASLPSCGERPDGGGPEAARPGGSVSPSAQLEVHQELRRDLAAPRHRSDGGGRAWIESGPGVTEDEVAAGGVGGWTLVYEAGPLGVAAGGWIFLQAPPFWGWSTPQAVAEEGLGYTTISTTAVGVELHPETAGQGLLGIRIGGRPLSEGERVVMVYGAGPAGAVADRFAEAESHFYLAVDGDGDGVRGLVDSRLSVPVVAGSPEQLLLKVSSTARPGGPFRLTVALLDRVGNACPRATGEVGLEASPTIEGLPITVELRPEDRGARTLELRAGGEGVYRIEGNGPGALSAAANPLVVSSAGRRILWGDLHGHSGLSDGTGTPSDYFRYAREVAALEVVALTDHDHWGMEPLALHPELWEQIRRETALHHEPGRFVTLLGYEWTSWLQGHRHVLYFEDRGEVLSALDPAYETPELLWQALRGQPALTFAHHSAGGPVATNWAYPPDPELEPVTEIVSVHGSSEAPDSPFPIYSPVAGNFVRDLLDRGSRVGFIGSGDGHDGHPGLAHLNAPSGGLAAILSEELTREGILEALRARRVYATNGRRIVLDARLAGLIMGSDLDARQLASAAPAELTVAAAAPGPLEAVTVIRSGRLDRVMSCGGETTCRVAVALADLEAGEYVYVRVAQRDGAAAWSSPFFIR